MKMSPIHGLSLTLLVTMVHVATAQSPSTFKYSVTDGKDVKVGGGELRLGGDEKIGLEIGGIKTEFSTVGGKVDVTSKSKTDVSWLSESGTVSTQAVVDPMGETVVRGFTKTGAPTYQLTDNTDGSRNIEIFQNGKIAYVFSIDSDGSFSLRTVAATSSASSNTKERSTTATAKPAASPKPVTQTASRPKTFTIPSNIQVTGNSPPPLP